MNATWCSSLFRQRDIVRIHARDQIAARLRDAVVQAGGDASIDPVAEQPDTCIQVTIPFEEGRGAVRRTVIDDDELEIGQSLAQYAVDRLGAVEYPIVDRHDHADHGLRGRARHYRLGRQMRMADGSLQERCLTLPACHGASMPTNRPLIPRKQASVAAIPPERRDNRRPATHRPACAEALAGLVGLTLAVPHAGIDAAERQQFLMIAALDDHALIEHDDLVGIHHRRQTMRDHQRGTVLRDLFERSLDLHFGVAVERRGRLVEHQHRRPLQDGAGNGDTLFLSARQFEAALTDFRLIALGHAPDEGVDLGKAAASSTSASVASQRP